MLSDNWLSRYRLLENFNKVERELRAVELKKDSDVYLSGFSKEHNSTMEDKWDDSDIFYALSDIIKYDRQMQGQLK